MTVTEFALLRLRRDGHDDPDLVEALLQCIEIQDQWIDRNQPHLRESGENQSSMYLQHDGSEPCLLITAQWDSPDGHRQWIQSEDNQQVMSELLAPHLLENDAVVLFHMEPAGRNPRLLLEDTLPRTPFNICRVSVEPSNRAAVQKDFQRLEEELMEASSKRQIWAGWRIEEQDSGASLVVFWDQALQSDKVETFLSGFEQRDVRTFKSICHDGLCKLLHDPLLRTQSPFSPVMGSYISEV